MKLEVGMYTRFDGKIGKVKSICTCEQCKNRGYYEPTIEYAHEETDYISCYWKDNLKASFNLIDLIEVGDILKIHLYSEICCIVEVDEIKYEDGSKYIGVYIPWHEGSSFEELKDLDIREVLAKEQYEANCYKVGE